MIDADLVCYVNRKKLIEYSDLKDLFVGNWF